MPVVLCACIVMFLLSIRVGACTSETVLGVAGVTGVCLGVGFLPLVTMGVFETAYLLTAYYLLNIWLTSRILK